MTPLDLLQSLKAYCKEITKDMRLIARVPENGTEAGERPPKVFVGNLPDKESEKKAAPYILLKLLTKKLMMKKVYVGCVLFALPILRTSRKTIYNV